LTGTQATLAQTILVYERLLTFKLGTVFDPPDGSLEPSLASAFEISGDGLQITLKLREGAKFDERAPTNGRNVTVEDVKYSFDKFAELSPNRGNVLNSVTPDMPIEGIETPDDSTIVVKLARPDGSASSMLAWSWFLSVMPTEAESGFNTAEEMRGTGPWMLTDYRPSVGWTYQRNPNWWNASSGRPFLDGIESTIIAETATLESQFSAGNVWEYAAPGPSVIPLAKQNPDALLFSESPFLGNGGYRAMGLSKLPDSPLQKDKRIRQAISMLIDRDLLNEVLGNVSGFADEGIEVETGWHSHAPLSWNTVWLDPRADKLGAASKYFQYNPEEAAALLRAADSFGLKQDFAQWSNMISSWEQQVELVAEMLQKDGHLELNRVVLDYRGDYQPKYNRTTLYDGMASFQIVSGLPTFNMTIWNTTAPGVRNAYINEWDDVPGLQDIMIRHRDAQTTEDQIQAAHDWQTLLAEEMPLIPYSQPDGTADYSFAWPWFSNYGVPRAWGGGTGAADAYINLWYDASKDTS
jgi:ABC-type transport system substrate-binding protein